MVKLIQCIILAVAFTSLVALTSGCTQERPAQTAALNKAQAEIKALQARVKTLASAEKTDAEKLLDMRIQGNMRRAMYTDVDFDPADRAFERVDASYGLGSFAIAIRNVAPYADGVRITLNIGNPSMATYDGLKLKLRYGERLQKGDYRGFFNSQKTRQVSIPSEILPGRWNSVHVILPQISPQKFGFFEIIRLATNKISFYR